MWIDEFPCHSSGLWRQREWNVNSNCSSFLYRGDADMYTDDKSRVSEALTLAVRRNFEISFFKSSFVSVYIYRWVAFNPTIFH